MNTAKKSFFLFIYFYAACFSSHLMASPNETLPIYHWSYEYIEELQVRGFCLDLLQMNKPYTRGEVAKSLVAAKLNFKEENKINPLRENILQKLIIEFSLEIIKLDLESDVYDCINVRSNIRTNIDKDEDDEIKYRGIYRSGIGLNLGKNVYFFSGVNFDQYDYHDPTYKGYKWRGIAGYTEQAYINVQLKRFQLKIGRDFLNWGVGKSSTLILSNAAPPLNHLFASVHFGPFKFSFFASELDEFPALLIDSTEVPVRRYLSGHRLDLSLWGGRVQAAVSELMLYGGVDETFDMAYLNPVIFFKGAHKNAAADANVLPTLDLIVYPLRNWQVYTSLLIDDIQIENTGPVDLEPDELGWLVGFKWGDPFQVRGLTVNTEYVRIANRTYKTELDYETFIHRNKPLGHPLGNDVEHWELGLTYWLQKNIWLKFQYSAARKGEGSIYSPWDTPWMNYTLEQGYRESFPTGVVEKSNGFNWEAVWYFSRWLRVSGHIDYWDINNKNNIPGKTTSYWEGKIRAEIEWTWNYKLIND